MVHKARKILIQWRKHFLRKCEEGSGLFLEELPISTRAPNNFSCDTIVKSQENFPKPNRQIPDILRNGSTACGLCFQICNRRYRGRSYSLFIGWNPTRITVNIEPERTRRLIRPLICRSDSSSGFWLGGVTRNEPRICTNGLDCRDQLAWSLVAGIQADCC